MNKNNTAHMTRMKQLMLNIRNDFWIVLLDIMAVNVAYYGALFLRFFVSNGFVGSGEQYFAMYNQIAPWYTIAAILIFALFRLYGGMWYYAGMNDMNRIAIANVCTMLIQFFGSMLVIRLLPKEMRYAFRMPISIYFIGALLQFILIVLIRFAYRILSVERQKIANRGLETVPAAVIGTGDLARRVMQHLEGNTPYRVVFFAGKNGGRMIDGIPVISRNGLENHIKEKDVKTIFIADKELTSEERDAIRQMAKKGIDQSGTPLNLEDFTGYMSNTQGFLPVTNLLEVMDMPITVIIDGEKRQFSSAEECLAALPGEYDVLRIQATQLTLKKKMLDENWMKVYQEQTGQDISYF